MFNKEIQKNYSGYCQHYDSGLPFLPKAGRISMFWEMYPNGAIKVSLPERDIDGNGMTCRCQVYAEKSSDSLIAESFAHRVSINPQDVDETGGEIDTYAAVRAAAISEALSLAGLELPFEVIAASFSETVAPETSPSEDVSEGTPIEEEIPIESKKDPIPPTEVTTAPTEGSTETTEITAETTEPEVAEEITESKTDPIEAPPNLNSSEYLEALQCPYQHQIKKGVLGDLLADDPSRRLLGWMASPSKIFRKKQPEVSMAAEIICIANNIKILN